MTGQIERSFRQELAARWTMSETTRAAIIAAIYAALTMAIAPLAYGAIQFRVGDLVCMVPFDRKYGGRGAAVGAIVGGIIIALFSPFGILDLFLGIASGIFFESFVWWMGIRTRGSDLGKQLAALGGNVITVFFIGYLLLHILFQCPLLEALGGVMVGGLVMMNGAGFGLLKALERTYKRKS